MHPDGQRRAPLLHQAFRQVDPEDTQLPIGNPDPEACAGIEIEAIRRAVGCRANLGPVEEHATRQDEEPGAKDGMVTGEAGMDDGAT